MPALIEGNRKEPLLSDNDSRTKPFDFSVSTIFAAPTGASSTSRILPLNTAAPKSACAIIRQTPATAAMDKTPTLAVLIVIAGAISRVAYQSIFF
jgi:hypothetical protein